MGNLLASAAFVLVVSACGKEEPRRDEDASIVFDARPADSSTPDAGPGRDSRTCPVEETSCDGLDDDCDGNIDEGLVERSYYRDSDRDGFGVLADSQTGCRAPIGYVEESGDCDDSTIDVSPAATESCNGTDDDCDEMIDDGVLLEFYPDADGDAFGAGSVPGFGCEVPVGFAPRTGDCAPDDASKHPGHVEYCNTVDDDCDDVADETGCVAAGEAHACGVVRGALVCWGDNRYGQLGDGTTSMRDGAVVPLVTAAQRGFSASTSHSCAVDVEGATWVWGYQPGGIGTGSESALVPTALSLVDGAACSAGDEHVCVVSGNGEISCWGNNEYGQLGIGTFSSSGTPARVDVPSAGSIATGDSHTCAVTYDKELYCWGSDAYGQLGDGSGFDSPLPVHVGLADVAFVSAGAASTCAITGGGSLYCWGDNASGQLGIGGLAATATPTLVALADVQAVAMGANHACAIVTGGALYCWGDNASGQVDGTGVLPGTDAPSDPVLEDSESVSVGDSYTCSALRLGGVSCWGLNDVGQTSVTTD